MVSKEMKLLMGESFYKLKSGEELYAHAKSYQNKFTESYKDTKSGQIMLNYMYAAFMEGYITEYICLNIAAMVFRGFLIPGHNKVESDNISLAILQYGVEQFNSGVCAYQIYFRYKDGTSGVIQSHDLAWRWLQKAAQLGCADAQSKLAYICYHDMNLPYDAEIWWLAAAKQGDTSAMYNLGILYGTDSFHNYPKAGYWLEQAAQRGYQNAESLLHKRYVYDQKHQCWWKRM